MVSIAISELLRRMTRDDFTWSRDVHPGAVFVVAHVCTRLCAHSELWPFNPCLSPPPLSLSLSVSFCLACSLARCPVACSCVIRRVPQRCITEWRESRRNALPARKSRYATSPVCRVTCAHATRLLSLSTWTIRSPQTPSGGHDKNATRRHRGAPLEFRGIVEPNTLLLVSNNVISHIGAIVMHFCVTPYIENNLLAIFSRF